MCLIIRIRNGIITNLGQITDNESLTIADIVTVAKPILDLFIFRNSVSMISSTTLQARFSLLLSVFAKSVSNLILLVFLSLLSSSSSIFQSYSSYFDPIVSCTINSLFAFPSYPNYTSTAAGALNHHQSIFWVQRIVYLIILQIHILYYSSASCGNRLIIIY